jgi:hypothetical protein
MNCILIGYGQIAKAVEAVFGEKHDIDIFSIEYVSPVIKENYDVMLVTMPFSSTFVQTTREYQELFKPKVTIIFSTTAIGTTNQISNAIHSPVEGKHPDLSESIRKMTRFVGGYSSLTGNAHTAMLDFFKNIPMNFEFVDDSTHTEALKLMSTTLYGVNIAYAKYCKEVADAIGMDYELVKCFTEDYNKLYRDLGMPQYQKYVLEAPDVAGIKGHCILENGIILMKQFPSALIDPMLALGKHPDTITGKPHLNKTWLACEHYGKKKTLVQIGKEVGCTPENISAIMKRRGLEVRQNHWTLEQEIQLAELAETKTFKEIAEVMDKTYNAIRTRAIQLGIASCYDPSERDDVTRQKISATLQGVTVEEWDGFKETVNALVRKSVEYQEWRKKVFERDGYTCQDCGKKGDKLNAHHILRFSEYPELRLDIDNGVTLCEECHKETHRKRDKEE